MTPSSAESLYHQGPLHLRPRPRPGVARHLPAPAAARRRARDAARAGQRLKRVPALHSRPLAPLPLESGSVGTIVASNFLEPVRIPDGERIRREGARVLRTGGRLIVVPPNFRLEPRRFLGDFTHQTPFTGVGFTDFLRSLGFRLLHSEPRYLPFSMNSRLPKWGWLVDLYLALPYHPPAGQFLVVAEAPPRS